MPGRAGQRGNSITAIDPVTGKVGPSIFVGSEPGKLALSDDGQFLYVAMVGVTGVTRVDLVREKVDLQFSLGSDELAGPFGAEDLAAPPGQPHTVAVARRQLAASPSFEGVVIYDDGVPRPVATSSQEYADVIAFGASAARLYGLNTQNSEAGFRRMRVDSSGVTVLDSGPLPGLRPEFKLDGRLLYSGSGAVFDPEARRQVGMFPEPPNLPYNAFGSLVLPDPASGRVFFLKGGDTSSSAQQQLFAYDRQSYLLAGSLDLPGVMGKAGSLVAWGTDGVAFRTDGDQVILLQTRLRTPSIRLADLTVTGSPSANPVKVGASLSYVLTVTNHGPDPVMDATLTDRVPAGAALVSAGATQGSCAAAGDRVTCDLGPLAAGDRATVTIVVRPGAPGPLAHTAVVSAAEPDPNPGNNSATQRVQVVAALPGPGGTPPALSVTVRPINLVTRDLVYDRVTGRIYASVPSSAGPGGNSVVGIDPETGMVGPPLFVGSEPGKLALSDDGQFLYAALDGAAAVRRIVMSSQTAELQFPVGSDPRSGPFFVGDMQVLPGVPTAVAIARMYQNLSPAEAGVAIYDDGVPRPRVAPGSDVLQFSASAVRLYGLSEYGLHRLEVDDLGVRELDVTPGLFHDPNVGMKFDQGLIFATTGQVIEPEEGQLAGTIPDLGGGALVAPDHAAGRVYYLSGMGPIRKLRVYDSHMLLLLGSVDIPGVMGRAGSLIRWGANGGSDFAFRTDANQVFLIHLTGVLASAGPVQ